MATGTQEKVIVIGAGTMGRGIAQVFAQSGYEVFLHDAVPAALESAVINIHKMLDRGVEKGRLKADDVAATKQRLRIVDAISKLSPCELVIEAATEKPDIKIAILKDVQKYVTDGGILATNTSSISITQLAAETDRPDRFIGMHFFNPVPLMQLVEVVKGLQTSDETVQQAVGIVPTDLCFSL